MDTLLLMCTKMDRAAIANLAQTSKSAREIMMRDEVWLALAKFRGLTMDDAMSPVRGFFAACRQRERNEAARQLALDAQLEAAIRLAKYDDARSAVEAGANVADVLDLLDSLVAFVHAPYHWELAKRASLWELMKAIAARGGKFTRQVRYKYFTRVAIERMDVDAIRFVALTGCGVRHAPLLRVWRR